MTWQYWVWVFSLTTEDHSNISGKNRVNRFDCLKESTQCLVFKSLPDNKLVFHFLFLCPSQESLVQAILLPSLTCVCGSAHTHTHTHLFSHPSTPTLLVSQIWRLYLTTMKKILQKYFYILCSLLEEVVGNSWQEPGCLPLNLSPYPSFS